MKLLRGVAPELPSLRFKTQQTEGTIRPDLWGFSDNQPRVFVENKFWAGLTDKQPVSYLKQLATYQQPTVLLVVGPAAREQTLWRELRRRLEVEGIPATERVAAVAIARSADTQLGPILALTSWENVLSVLEYECISAPTTIGDLIQLRALCDTADSDAFAPVSRVEITDQRTSAFVLQLGAIIQATTDLGVTEKVLLISGLRPQASWERIGRYVRVMGTQSSGSAGAWFGIHFGLWKTHGTTPLWLVFADDDFGRGQEVRPLIESWVTKKGILTVASDHDFAISLEVPVGEEKDVVVRSLVNDLREIAAAIAALPKQPDTYAEPEKDHGV